MVSGSSVNKTYNGEGRPVMLLAFALIYVSAKHEP